jgi:hypothetical protein
MKVSPKDMPKVMLLVVLIGGCLIYIGSLLLNRPAETVRKAAPPREIMAGQPTQTAALEPMATDQQYVEQIESWGRPPVAPQGEPFRMVLSQDIIDAMRRQRGPSTTGSSRPPSELGIYSSDGNRVFDPLQDPSRAIDFPMVTVQGVIVDTSLGAPTNFATVLVDDRVRFVKAGDPLGDDLVVERVTNRGVQIRAAKEHAFIEVSKGYKPTGMSAAAASAAGNRRGRRSR